MLKKVFDYVFVLITTPIWLPAIIITTFLSFIINGRPIFFCQYRGGYKNKKFKIIKFRTMDANEHINNFNSFLRVSKIDELPQIINILLGQLSLVGPRPLQFEYQKLYNEEQLKRFNVMPGITGWSQINSKENATTWKRKFELDIWYVENCSFLLDLKIIFLTLKIISLSFFKKNKKSYRIKEFNGSN